MSFTDEIRSLETLHLLVSHSNDFTGLPNRPGKIDTDPELINKFEKRVEEGDAVSGNAIAGLAKGSDAIITAQMRLCDSVGY